MTDRVLCIMFPALQGSLAQRPICRTMISARVINLGVIRFVLCNEIDSMTVAPAEKIHCRIYSFSQNPSALIPNRGVFLSIFFIRFDYIRFVPWSEKGPMGNAGNLNKFPCESLL